MIRLWLHALAHLFGTYSAEPHFAGLNTANPVWGWRCRDCGRFEPWGGD